MPIYEYECGACKHQFEVLQKVSDAPIMVCPDCGKKKVNKLVSGAGFQLKGTGWYATDFKDKDKPKPKKEENSVKKDEAKSTTKGEGS